MSQLSHKPSSGRVRRKLTNVERLAANLFDRVQKSQGFAFISDGETFDTETEFFKRLHGRLRWTEESARIIRNFIVQFEPLRLPRRKKGKRA